MASYILLLKRNHKNVSYFASYWFTNHKSAAHLRPSIKNKRLICQAAASVKVRCPWNKGGDPQYSCPSHVNIIKVWEHTDRYGSLQAQWSLQMWNSFQNPDRRMIQKQDSQASLTQQILQYCAAQWAALHTLSSNRKTDNLGWESRSDEKHDVRWCLNRLARTDGCRTGWCEKGWAALHQTHYLLISRGKTNMRTDDIIGWSWKSKIYKATSLIADAYNQRNMHDPAPTLSHPTLNWSSIYVS